MFILGEILLQIGVQKVALTEEAQNFPSYWTIAFKHLKQTRPILALLYKEKNEKEAKVCTSVSKLTRVVKIVCLIVPLVCDDQLEVCGFFVCDPENDGFKTEFELE